MVFIVIRFINMIFGTQTLFEQKLKGSDTILCVIGYQKPYVMLLVAYKNAGKLKHAGV